MSIARRSRWTPPTGSRRPARVELERHIRDRIEATRPKPRIDTLREQARQGPPPLLGLRERLRNLNFNNSSVRDILSIIGSSAGIRITYDQAYQDKAYSIELEDVTVEEALQQIMSANQFFYKVINPKTIIVVNDRADKRQQYDDMVVRVFYVSHADAQELSQMVTTVMRVPQMPVAPVIMPNKTANTITVRATTQVADIIERIIRSNDKPRAEVVIDVQILEVNRQRVKQLGLNLNAYALGFIFSPEVAPPNTQRAADRCAAVAAAVQREHDQPGRQRRRLLYDRADGAGAVPRDRFTHRRRLPSRSCAAPRAPS